MSGRYASIRTLRLFPYPSYTKLLELIKKDSQPRKTARALVLVEADNAREAIEQSSDFMDNVCWLFGLAQRNSVSYWGVAAYHHKPESWTIDRRTWGVVRTEPPWSHTGHRISTTQLQPLFRMWLKAIDDLEFPLYDFRNSISLFLDSSRPEQFLEVMFLEAWIAFEVLVNQLAERTKSQYSMSEDIFDKLRDAVKQYIKQNFKAKLGSSYTNVIEQLLALQRVPVGHLIERFASKYGLRTEMYDIDNLKRIRNGLMHSGKEPPKAPLDFDALRRMRNLLEDSLLAMIGTKEVQPEKFPPVPEVDEDPANKEVKLEEYTLSFGGKVLDETGKTLTEGEFDARWTTQKLEISGKVEDPWALLRISETSEATCLLLGRSGIVSVSVMKARPTLLGHSKVELQAIHISLDYPV